MAKSRWLWLSPCLRLTEDILLIIFRDHVFTMVPLSHPQLPGKAFVFSNSSLSVVFCFFWTKSSCKNILWWLLNHGLVLPSFYQPSSDSANTTLGSFPLVASFHYVPWTFWLGLKERSDTWLPQKHLPTDTWPVFRKAPARYYIVFLYKQI